MATRWRPTGRPAISEVTARFHQLTGFSYLPSAWKNRMVGARWKRSDRLLRLFGRGALCACWEQVGRSSQRHLFRFFGSGSTRCAGYNSTGHSVDEDARPTNKELYRLTSIRIDSPAYSVSAGSSQRVGQKYWHQHLYWHKHQGCKPPTDRESATSKAPADPARRKSKLTAGLMESKTSGHLSLGGLKKRRRWAWNGDTGAGRQVQLGA